MSIWTDSIFYRELMKRTSIFNLRLYVVICVIAGFVLVLLFVICLLCCCCRSTSRKSKKSRYKQSPPRNSSQNQVSQPPPLPPQPPPPPPSLEEFPPAQKEIAVDIGFHQADYNIHSEDLIRRYNENQVLQQRKPQPLMHVPEDLVLDIDSDREEEKAATHLSQLQPKSEAQLHPQMQPEAIRLGAGWYTLKELDDATNKFSDENVLGKGRNGTVYRGVLDDGTPIAIKNLLNNKGQAEEEFKAEVEVIGRVRHKHLVKLLGYCVEDECRMLVYEYVNNGNLDQWLHVNVAGDDSPLTWNTRMHIILGVAKGLAYLHEGLEPKVVHRDVKASNILLTENWVPKISDFGLARHLESGVSHITTRVMGTFGYVAPEYACTGMLNVKSDVYSFGVLIMEIISGRTPVDYRRPRDEIQLVEWLKDMIGDRRYEEVLDPKMPVKPCRKALKRALLVALQCVDPDSDERPSMGSVVHMLETDSILFSEEKGQSRRTFSSSSSTLSIEKKSPDIYAQNVDERLPHEWI